MSTRTSIIPLQSSQTGLTLSAQLVDAAGVNSGAAVTSGFAELGDGFYLWTYAGFPTQFRGAVAFKSGGSIVATMAINPEEAENVDATVSSRSTYGGGPVASVANLQPIAVDSGAVLGSPAPTATTYSATGLTATAAGAYVGSQHVFQTSSSLGHAHRVVTDHTITAGSPPVHNFTVTTSTGITPTVGPSAGDTFLGG